MSVSIYERYHRLCQDARQTYTIEDLSGIGPAKADALQVAGIESVEDVVETDVTHIQEIKGIGSQQAQRIKSEANKLVPKSSVSEDPVIVDEQLLDTVENRYSPDYESLTEAEESLDTLESWINIYHWYNKLYRRARECQEDLTIEDINLPGIGSTKLSALQDIGIYTINDAMKADIEDLTRAPGIGNRLAHKIKDCVNDLAMLTSYENHINILVSRYSPEYDSLREAQKLLNEFEAWIETHERFKKCYISGIAWEPKCKTEIQLEDGQTFEIPYGDYRPSRFNSVNDARRNIRTLEMVFEIIEFLAETDSNHPSVDANSWYEAISTALEEQYPEILEPIQSQVKRMSDSLWQSEDLFKYNWSEFEDLIGTLYRKQGYDVEVTQNVADKGVDIWAKKDDETVAIQVKHLGSARLSWGAM